MHHQEKNLRKGAIDVGGGGEVGAKRFEAYEAFVWKTVAATFPFFSRRMVDPKPCFLIAALASIGKAEFAAVFFNAAKLLMSMTFAAIVFVVVLVFWVAVL